MPAMAPEQVPVHAPPVGGHAFVLHERQNVRETPAITPWFR